MKFGGAAVRSVKCFGTIASVVKERRKEWRQVVVVISAMGDTTEWLRRLARQVCENPSGRELDMLLTVGERVSISLLAMALGDAVSFTGSQSGIITSNDHADARVVDVRPFRVQETLRDGKIAVVAGYQGVSDRKDVTTLGVGGSDISAVALGAALGGARVEFFKDVGALYTADPDEQPDAELLEFCSYEQTLEIAERAKHPPLHPRAIVLAEVNALPLAICSLDGKLGSWIGPREPSERKPVFEKNCSEMGCH